MRDKTGKILIVDDNEDVLFSIGMLLKRHVGEVRTIKNPNRIEEFLNSFKPDVVLLDMNFTRNVICGEEGYYWLDFILNKSPRTVVLFITAYVDTEKAVRAIKAGAVDFIPKPWDNEKLLGIVESAVELSYSRRGTSLVRQSDSSAVPLLIGESPQMLKLKDQIARVGATEANILITGENGTGKDVVANMLHAYSPRNKKPMVSVDLGTIPEQLFESELFGYEKGAFTDARIAKEGKLETASGGTVFLDEIGNLSTALQQKLLTLIEKKVLSRLGSNTTKKVDIRILAATNADLVQLVAEGVFRQDLLYRINTIELHLPSLRERGNDIVLLAEYFAKKISKQYKIEEVCLSPEVKNMLMKHSWPGNVRELMHVMERAIILSTTSTLQTKDIEFPRTLSSVSKTETLNLQELEHEAIMKAIDRANGNLSHAATLLGISRYSLYRKIEKLGI